jgi:sulfur-oxidizing protein SoxY
MQDGSAGSLYEGEMVMTDCHPTRRYMLALTASAAALPMLPAPTQAETADTVAAIRKFTGGTAFTPGKLKLDISPLVENGNSVSMSVIADHPMTEQSYVKRMAVFTEKNPQAEVAVFHLNPRSGTATVGCRIRLATTQTVTAVAELSDGRFWKDEVDVLVTIAACTEE